jgi:hypothetical protein
MMSPSTLEALPGSHNPPPPHFVFCIVKLYILRSRVTVYFACLLEYRLQQRHPLPQILCYVHEILLNPFHNCTLLHGLVASTSKFLGSVFKAVACFIINLNHDDDTRFSAAALRMLLQPSAALELRLREKFTAAG